MHQKAFASCWHIWSGPTTMVILCNYGKEGGKFNLKFQEISPSEMEEEFICNIEDVTGQNEQRKSSSYIWTLTLYHQGILFWWRSHMIAIQVQYWWRSLTKEQQDWLTYCLWSPENVFPAWWGSLILLQSYPYYTHHNRQGCLFATSFNTSPLTMWHLKMLGHLTKAGNY